MPSFLTRQNRNQVPVSALWLSNLVIQDLLIVTSFAAETFSLALRMTSAMTLLPYLLVAGYGLRLAWSGETYAAEPRARRADLLCSAVAVLYAAAMLAAGGPTSCCCRPPSTPRARRSTCSPDASVASACSRQPSGSASPPSPWRRWSDSTACGRVRSASDVHPSSVARVTRGAWGRGFVWRSEWNGLRCGRAAS